MKMKNLLFYLILIYITVFVFSCVPAPENANPARGSGNYILLGLYHGAIVPFSLLGKLIGFNIGIWDAGKVKDLSYWMGYGFALYKYFRLIRLYTFCWWKSRKA